MHAGDGGVQRGVVHGRGFQRTERAALQFGQHEVQPRRHFVARDQAAAEHFLLALVQGMVGVVEGFHAKLKRGEERQCTSASPRVCPDRLDSEVTACGQIIPLSYHPQRRPACVATPS
ncbi:hypothetical protein D9M68_837300 [compost metagenome]